MANEITYDDLQDEFYRVSREHCNFNTPKTGDMNKYSEFSHGIYVYRFGSWNEAVEEFGFKPNREVGEYKLSEEKLFGKLRDFQAEKGKVPTMEEFEEWSGLNRKRYTKKFGSWNNALKEAGLSVNSRMYIDKNEVEEDILSVKEEVGGVPTWTEYEEHGSFSQSVIERLFGKWTQAVKEVGLEPIVNNCGEEHWNWTPNSKRYYGPSWRPQRRKAWKRDDYRCQVCFKSQRKIGKKPDVHHINPTKNWDVEEEYEEMNNLDNLICLCNSCHGILENRMQGYNYSEFKKKAREENGI